MIESTVTRIIVSMVRQNPKMSAIKMGILAACYSDSPQVTELAKTFGVSMPSISKASSELQRGKLLKKRRLNDDKRCVALCITDKGRSLLERIS
jgi:hypothetical protein